MANQAVEFVKQVASLTRDVQQGKASIKELREDLKLANQKIDRLMEAFQRLTYEFQRDRENGGHERALQKLEIENILLRERQLPPVPPKEEKDAEIEALRRENEELRKRLERLEQQDKE